MRVIEEFVAGKLTQAPSWEVHVAGNLDVLPDSTARALKEAVEASRDCATGRHACRSAQGQRSRPK
jgi:short-chain Z-isoprenyl diphosphate synthase